MIDCCTKLGIDRSQVEKVGSVSIHNRNLQVLVTEMFKINRGISSSIKKGIFELKAEHPYNLRCISYFSAPFRRATRRGGGGSLPLPFFENQKKCPDFAKKALNVSILRLNLPFKMYFKSV